MVFIEKQKYKNGNDRDLTKSYQNIYIIDYPFF